MSAIAAQWARTWRPTRMTHNRAALRLTVQTLAAHADHAGYISTARVEDLAAELACSTRTVPRLVAELIAQGVLAVKRRFVAGRGQIANLYRLLSEAVLAEHAQLEHEPAPRMLDGCLHSMPACADCLRSGRGIGIGPPRR